MLKTLLASTVMAIAMGVAAHADDASSALQPGTTWPDLRGDVVGDAEIADGESLFDITAPYRAHDAATVPIEIIQKDPSVTIHKATVVIDENPAPVAAELTFSKAMEPIDFEMRVRVNQYSNVRVIAETDKGLAMNGRFVKASGGCSAPASKDPQLALSTMGQMKLKSFNTEPAQSTPRREAQIMIRHPNYSGLQRDQVTQLFIPAHFMDHIEVWQGEEQLFAIDGGISISENPVFRFSYTDNGAASLTVKATDTEGNSFETELSKQEAS